MASELKLYPGRLELADLHRVRSGPIRLSLQESAWIEIDRSAAVVQRVIAEGRTVYGINTGFGLLANTRIAAEELETLQRSIVLSHAAGLGRFMRPSTVRLLIAAKINSLARGYSGVRRAVVESLLALLEHDIIPAIPEKGSVGASGDLAPLAHLACVLLGEGEVLEDGQPVPAGDVLARHGISPLKLAPKEGLALLNGTQASTALALEGLLDAENALRSAVLIGSMAVEAALGSRQPFDVRIHEVRGQAGQIQIARCYRKVLGERSEIGDSHAGCEKVQDPYSLRCQPQVMGACLQQIRHAAEVLLAEVNGVSDNPLVFAEDEEILSGGNFHAEPVAMVADQLAVALAEIGALSERRTALLIDSHLSGLPPFLVENGGVNSGFMIAQVSAAALASENKSLAHPASVDSLPTSANQEDHVSMATFAARRLADIHENVQGILAIEWLAAAQGLDFRRPLKSTPLIEQAHALLRAEVPFYAKDRYFAPDIARASGLIGSGRLAGLLPALL